MSSLRIIIIGAICNTLFSQLLPESLQGINLLTFVNQLLFSLLVLLFIRRPHD